MHLAKIEQKGMHNWWIVLMTSWINKITNEFNAILGLFCIGVLIKKNLYKTKGEQLPSKINQVNAWNNQYAD